jgi:hypothetical protein
MKYIVVIFVALLSQDVLACGGSSGNDPIEIALLSSMLVVFLCSLAMPVANMLSINAISKFQLISMALVVVVGVTISLGFMFGDTPYGSEAAGVLISALTMSIPTMVYFYKVLKIKLSENHV